MAIIEIDLEDYKDEIVFNFCENNNCLLQKMRCDIKKKFKDYVTQLDRDIYIRNDKTITVEKILQDLKYFLAEMN